MENILDMLVEYSKQGKKIDLEYIRKVVEILIGYKDLEEYISSVDFSPKIDNSKDIGGIYSIETNDIVISEYMVYSYHRKVKNSNSTGLSTFEEMLTGNALATQTILHEIEHANQHKKANDGVCFENLLLKILFCLYNNVFDKKLEVSYEDINCFFALKNLYGMNEPSERLAEIYSMQEIMGVMMPLFNDLHPNIKPFFEGRLHRRYVAGYELGQAGPTIRYLMDYRALDIEAICEFFDDKFYAELALEANGPLESRLLLGLTVAYDEFIDYKVKKKIK